MCEEDIPEGTAVNMKATEMEPESTKDTEEEVS